MNVTIIRSTIDKIIAAIKRKGGIATLTDIKRSINEFNQGGGVEKLKQYIADMIAKGTIVSQTGKGSNGQTIESYRLTNRNVSNGSNSNGGNNGNGNLKITVTLDIALEGAMDIFHSWLNADDGNSSNNDNGNEGNDDNDGNGDESNKSNVDPLFDDDTLSGKSNSDEVVPSDKLPSQHSRPPQHSQSNQNHSNPNHNRFQFSGKNRKHCPYKGNKAPAKPNPPQRQNDPIEDDYDETDSDIPF